MSEPQRREKPMRATAAVDGRPFEAAHARLSDETRSWLKPRTGSARRLLHADYAAAALSVKE